MMAGVPEGPLLSHRGRLLFSLGLGVVGLVGFTVLHGRPWSWPLFGWGFALGLFGLALSELTFLLF
jgi:hypothetical protein